MSQNKYITLATLLRNEYRPLAEFDRQRDIRLRRLVQHAYRKVPFYRDHFDAAGVHPDDIRTVEDLQALPVVRKRDLIDADPLRTRDPSVPAEALVERRTSGSSGVPFRFYVDRSYDRFCKAQFLRPYISNGRSIFDTAYTISSREPPPKKWFQRVGMLDNIVVPSHFDGARLLGEYLRVRPKIVTGYPSTLTVLADAINGTAGPTHQPKTVFTDSELLTPDVHDKLAQAFRAPVIDVYGTIETDNIAWQCGDRSRYHYAYDCVILETLVDGQRAKPDQQGVLVCTVLNSLTMPFIRYEIGDLVTLSSETCDCGRTLPLISGIEGRQVDQVVLPDGGRVSPMAFLQLSKTLSDLAREYQIIQDSVNEFSVLVVLKRPLDEAASNAISAIATDINPAARTTIKQVDSIAREPSGKRRVFVSKVN